MFEQTPWSSGVATPIQPNLATDETAVAHALLFEIHSLTKQLLEDGQSGTIDFRAVPPMGPGAHAFLKQWLSVGDVTATVDGIGRTEINETGYPGVWWLTHRDDDGQIIGETVEVTEIPEILKSHREEIRSGLHTMNELLIGV